jgi:Secretion system C-terminal sorting domain
MKTRLIFAAIFAFLFTFTAIAENFDGKKRKDKKRHKGLKKEIKAYIDQKVLPVLREQRNKLESKITLQDRQKLDELRKELESLQGQRKSFRKDMIQILEKDEISEEQRSKMKEVHNKMQSIMQSSKEIAKNYTSDIEVLLLPLESQKEQWKQDIKAICEKYQKKDVDSTHRHKHRMFKMMAKQHFKEMKPAMFLLMQTTENEAIKTMSQENKDSSVDEKANIYPNPSINKQTTIDFKVKEAGNINIVLLDAQGNIVRNVMNENKEKGKYSVIVDLNGLKEATYFYKIVMPNKTETNKLIVKD